MHAVLGAVRVVAQLRVGALLESRQLGPLRHRRRPCQLVDDPQGGLGAVAHEQLVEAVHLARERVAGLPLDRRRLVAGQALLLDEVAEQGPEAGEGEDQHAAAEVPRGLAVAEHEPAVGRQVALGFLCDPEGHGDGTGGTEGLVIHRFPHWMSSIVFPSRDGADLVVVVKIARGKSPTNVHLSEIRPTLCFQMPK